MVGALQYPQSVFQALILSKTVCPDDHTGWPRLALRGGRAENVLTISRQPRWSAIGMSSKRWLTACTGVQAGVSAQHIARFRANPAGQGLCARPVTGGLRRCLAGRANPRNSTAMAAVSRAGARPLSYHPAKPLSRREEIVSTFLSAC